MFRLFARDALVAGVLLMLLAAAAAVLGLPTVAPPPAVPWGPELARLDADPTLLARDAALAAFGLAATAALLRFLASGLHLVGRDYPAMAHLAEVLAGALARRVGALVGVSLTVLQGGGLARAVGGPRHPARIAPAAPAALAQRADVTAVPPSSARSPLRAAPLRPTARPEARRPVRRRVGLALRYTVQPDDTMDDVAARFGLPDWRPIMRATRSLPQPVAGPIVDPDDIYPGQILLIPLPCPALRLSGDYVLYVVRRGDYLSAIAARFLGDWRAYRAIAALNRGVHQPDGGALEDDSLIQPGWVLRLPRAYVATGPDGASVPHRVIVDETRPVRVRRGLRPRRPAAPSVRARGAPMPRHHAPPTPDGPVTARARCTDDGARPRPRPVGATRPTRAPSITRQSGSQEGATTRRGKGHRPIPGPSPARRGHARPSERQVRGDATPRAVIRPKRHVHPGGRVSVSPSEHPTASAPTVAPRPIPIARPGRSHAPGAARRSAPSPPPALDVGRVLPLPLLLMFGPVLALVALKRRRVASAARAIPTYAGTRLAPSMRRAIEGVRDGGRRHTVTALDTGAAAREVDVVGHVVTLLQGAGTAAAGMPTGLAETIRTVTVTADTVAVVIEARGLSDEVLTAVATTVGDTLGTRVRGEKVAETDNSPCVRLTLARAAVAGAARGTIPAAVRPHPAPLLIPLGRTAEGADLYVNLARLGPVLIAGGARGANTLVATLLASALAQADPAGLRLLVSSNDDELRGVLPVLEHLEAPPADARDVSAAAGIVAQAHTLVLDRFTADGSGPDGPAYLIMLDLVEELRADPQALDRLDVLCRNGRVCGVHVVATTSDVQALAGAGLLDVFETRLARPLPLEESSLLYGDDSAARLAPDEALLRTSLAGEETRLAPFTLPLPVVRTVVAHIAVALTPERDQGIPEGEVSPIVDTPMPPGGAAAASPASTAPPAEREAASPREPSESPPRAPDPLDTGTQEGAPGHVLAADIVATSGGVSGADATITERSQGQEQAGAAPRVPVPAEPGTHARTVPPAGDRQAAPTPTMDAVHIVDLRVLGGIVVLARGMPVVMQPREQRLLAALAIMGPTPVRPDRLVEALFTDDDPLTGQDKLQHSITDIRLVLKKAGVPVKRAGVVRHTAAGYTLDTALVRADAHLFRDLLRRSETADARERGALLAQAVELYRGDLCGDQELEWVEGYRYAWRKEYLEALYELALYYEQVEGDQLGALRVARRLVAEEPLQDHYHQMVLELIAATGDLDALDSYNEEMRAAYARRDTEVDGYTAALYERLRGQVERERRTTDGPAARAG